MDDFRMKLQDEVKEISEKISQGTQLTEQDLKKVFLATFLNEEGYE